MAKPILLERAKEGLRQRPLRPWVLLLFLGILIADQLSKAWVLATPEFNALGCLGEPFLCRKIELSSVFDLTMLWNYGISFGQFQAYGIGRWLLVLLSAGISVVFMYWFLIADRKWTRLALVLVVAGAIGNIIDRVRFGAVVDFFDFSGPWFGWEIPLPGFLRFLEQPFAHTSDGYLGIGFPYVFNVADTAVTVGAILLFIDLLLTPDNAGKAGKGEGSGLEGREG